VDEDYEHGGGGNGNGGNQLDHYKGDESGAPSAFPHCALQSSPNEKIVAAVSKVEDADSRYQ